MKAPEKIYIFENPITGTPDDRWLSKRSDDEDIEYTRTDAFIEKTCKWIKENSEMYIICEDHFYSGWLNEDFYEELKKAMRRE